MAALKCCEYHKQKILLFAEVFWKDGLQIINVIYQFTPIGYLPAIFKDQYSITIH